jgi:hypothetical protein
MSPEFETFLARLYTDRQLRARFLADPRAEAERQGRFHAALKEKGRVQGAPTISCVPDD